MAASYQQTLDQIKQDCSHLTLTLTNPTALSTRGISSLLAQLREFDGVPIKTVAPSRTYHELKKPNEDDFCRQWGLHNTGANYCESATPMNDVNAPEAWEVTTGSTNTIIAVIDSGLSNDHDFNGNLGSDHYDFLGGGASTQPPEDLRDHGTRVASIIAARGNNGLAIAGTMWEAQLMILRVINQNGDVCSDDVVKAVCHAREKGARVVNLSLGGCEEDSALRQLIKDSKMTLFAAAAGNYPTSLDTCPIYPAAYSSASAKSNNSYLPNLLSVMAVDNLAEVVTKWTVGGLVGAPGTCISSLDDRGTVVESRGTSYAAPFVSGTAGLVFSKYPALSGADVAECIYETAANLQAGGGSKGLIDARKALDKCSTKPAQYALPVP